MATKKAKIIGWVLATVSLGSFLLFYFGNRPIDANRLFSSQQMLNNVWQNYKQQYVDDSGRTIDKNSNQGQDITTSEGQSYTMLRAVWMSDKPTFDKVFHWTQQNLKQSNGNLFSWLYGKRADGTNGILVAKGGQNTASDADSDIALSLIFAYARWNDPAYLTAAKAIINDIWDQEVVVINGMPYLTADNLERNSPTPIVNPSYLSPASYRIFAQVDRSPDHDWGKVVQTSYQVLNESIWRPLDKKTSANLPPDWVQLDRSTGQLKGASTRNLTTNYGFDAVRVSWRVALDSQWFGDTRDNEVLYRLSFLSDQWKQHGALASVYSHDGKVVQQPEWPSIYGASLGYFMVADSSLANDVFSQKLQSLYDPNTQTWIKKLSYYDDTWAWFGLALYLHDLPNLAKASVF